VPDICVRTRRRKEAMRWHIMTFSLSICLQILSTPSSPKTIQKFACSESVQVFIRINIRIKLTSEL